MSDEQTAVLAGTERKIVLMFDGHDAGQHGMRLAVGKLIRQCFVRAVKLAEAQQSDQLSVQELGQVLSFRS